MNYKDYQDARDAAWKILLDCGVNRLPVEITQICRKLYKPDEVPNPCTCFVHRSEWPNCLDCQNWHPDDHRCMHPRSQWAVLITSPDNYCRFFERRPPGL